MQFSLPLLLLVGIAVALAVLLVRLRGSDPRRDSLMGTPRSARPSIPTSTMPPPSTLNPEVIAQVQKLVAAGKLIDAIKLIRSRGGIGLKEAKDLLERLNR